MATTILKAARLPDFLPFRNRKSRWLPSPCALPILVTALLMKSKSDYQNHSSSIFSRPNALTFALLFLLAGPLWAQTNYLASLRPDGVALLPPPPAAGSVEEAADLAEAKAVFHARTPAETARATKDSTLSFSLFRSAIGPVFELDKLPNTEFLMQRVKKEIQTAINLPKDFYKRKRPYQLDDKLSLGKPEPSFSYPSGHSTRGTVYAMVLAELFPEKKDAILQIGRNIGWDRVLIGKHFPTDIYAGRVLGQAIVHELLASKNFQRDFAAAREEIAAAKSRPVLQSAK
jgi:acid phosphatase (class A)